MYKILKLIDKGAFGVVYEAEQLTLNCEVALKVIERKRIENNLSLVNSWEEEVTNLRKLNHPGIVGYYQSYTNKNSYILVMELISGFTLRKYATDNNGLSENTARTFCRQILSALAHMHGRNIMHRDLKPTNIMVMRDTSVVKIVDFGLSIYMAPNDVIRTSCGTKGYVAPEMYQQFAYTTKLDIWCFGIIAFEMVSLIQPDVTPSRKELLFLDFNVVVFLKLKQAMHYLPYRLSKQFRNFIQSVLQPDPDHRPNAQKLLTNVWVTDNFKYPPQLNNYRKLEAPVQYNILKSLGTKLNKSIKCVERQVSNMPNSGVAAMYRIMCRPKLDEANKDLWTTSAAPQKRTVDDLDLISFKEPRLTTKVNDI